MTRKFPNPPAPIPPPSPPRQAGQAHARPIGMPPPATKFLQPPPVQAKPATAAPAWKQPPARLAPAAGRTVQPFLSCLRLAFPCCFPKPYSAVPTQDADIELGNGGWSEYTKFFSADKRFYVNSSFTRFKVYAKPGKEIKLAAEYASLSALHGDAAFSGYVLPIYGFDKSENYYECKFIDGYGSKGEKVTIMQILARKDAAAVKIKKGIDAIATHIREVGDIGDLEFMVEKTTHNVYVIDPTNLGPPRQASGGLAILKPFELAFAGTAKIPTGGATGKSD